MQKIQQPIISFLLGLLSALTLGYFISSNFRDNIEHAGIDATMVTGLIASFALIATLFQNTAMIKQNVRERNFVYRMSVKSKFEDMSLIVIAKLYSFEARRQVSVFTVQAIKKCMAEGKRYHDASNITSTEDFNSDNCKATAVLDVYFPNQGEKWNEVITILNEMGSIASMTVLNYFENDYGQKTTEWMTNIDKHIKRLEELDAQMGEKPQEIRTGVVEEVNKHVLNLTKL